MASLFAFVVYCFPVPASSGVRPEQLSPCFEAPNGYGNCSARIEAYTFQRFECRRFLASGPGADCGMTKNYFKNLEGCMKRMAAKTAYLF